MQVKPLNGRLVVQVHEEENPDKVLSGVLFKPEGAHEDIYARGTVVAVAEHKWSKKGRPEPMEVEVGDTVVFIKFLRNTKTGESLAKCLPDGQFIIHESDVVAVEI
jgi:co-chaperonin GroES (HSP10)